MERSRKRGTQGWEIPDRGSSEGRKPAEQPEEGSVRFGSEQSHEPGNLGSEAGPGGGEASRLFLKRPGRKGEAEPGKPSSASLREDPLRLCARTGSPFLLCRPAAPSPCAPAAASLNADRQPLPRRSSPRPRPQPARLANGSSLPRTPRPRARRGFYATLGFPAGRGAVGGGTFFMNERQRGEKRSRDGGRGRGGEVEVRRLEPLERLGDRCAPAGSARAAGAGSEKDLRLAPARRAYRMNRLNPRWFKCFLRLGPGFSGGAGH